MSKSENAPKPVKKTYKYFDLDTMKKVEVEREIPPFVSKTSDEILTLVSNDNDLLTKAVNAFLKRQELKKVKLEVAALGGSTTVVMQLAKPFRAMPPWSEMYELGTDGKPKVDKDGEKIIDRTAQTASILEFLNGNPKIKESIKAASIAAAQADDEDEDDKKDED